MAASLRGKAEVIPIDPHRPEWARVRRVAAALRRGEVVAIPTDTFYGLAGDPFRPGLAQRIFQIKQRPATRPILLLIASMGQLRQLVCEVPPLFPRIAAAFWPGPLTIVLRAADNIPEQITAGTGTLAVRWPAAALTRALIVAAGRPLTGTSANRSGQRPAASAAEAQLQLGHRVYYIVDGGRAPSRRPSTILDLTNRPRILREGAVSTARLMKYLR